MLLDECIVCLIFVLVFVVKSDGYIDVKECAVID